MVSESPSLASYYAHRSQRADLVNLSLSDPSTFTQLRPGDFIIIARGRRYFSNDAFSKSLLTQSTPILDLKLGEVPSVKVYQIDENDSHRLGLVP